jgi:hypothetical protein
MAGRALCGSNLQTTLFAMSDEPAWVRDDVDAILTALFDIRRLLTTLLVELIEDEGEEVTDA